VHIVDVLGALASASHPAQVTESLLKAPL
jgi:hypothetical protein